MRAISVTDFRKNIAAMMDRVIDDELPLIVTRSGQRNVVVVSEKEWGSIQETLYLLANPRNALRLAQAVLDLNAGKAEPHDLIEVGPEAGAAAAE